jgi:hypothetical protein
MNWNLIHLGVRRGPLFLWSVALLTQHLVLALRLAHALLLSIQTPRARKGLLALLLRLPLPPQQASVANSEIFLDLDGTLVAAPVQA